MKRGALVPALLLLLPLAGFVASRSGSRAQDDGKPQGNAQDADAHPTDLWTESGQCGKCHVEASWRKVKAPPAEEFNHASTGFPLRGAHETTDCSECHTRGLSALSQDCTTCHRDPHVGANTKHCTLCHNERKWKLPRNFFNHGRTRFPLMGKHAALACESCHRNARTEPLRSTPSECIVCHARDFRAAASRGAPDHTLGPPFGPDCARCHNKAIPPRSWEDALIR